MASRKTLLLFFFFVMALSARAQPYVVPAGYKMHNRADYEKYQPDLIATVDWLQATPWTEDTQKRRAATDFLFKWIQDTPTFTLELMPAVMGITAKNNKLLATFMGAYAKYAIENPAFTRDAANIVAVKAVIAKYKVEPSHIKDNNIERLIKLEKDGDLDDWVRTEYQRATP